MKEVWQLRLPRETLYFSQQVYAAQYIQGLYPLDFVAIRPFSRADEFGCFIKDHEMVAQLLRKFITQ